MATTQQTQVLLLHRLHVQLLSQPCSSFSPLMFLTCPTQQVPTKLPLPPLVNLLALLSLSDLVYKTCIHCWISLIFLSTMTLNAMCLFLLRFFRNAVSLYRDSTIGFNEWGLWIFNGFKFFFFCFLSFFIFGGGWEC